MPLLQVEPRKILREQQTTRPNKSTAVCLQCLLLLCGLLQTQTVPVLLHTAAGTAHTNRIITHTESAEGKGRPNLRVWSSAALSTVMMPLAGYRPTASSGNTLQD